MRYFLRRLGFYAIALWAGVTLDFFIPHLMPGDPLGAMLARVQGSLTPEAIQALRVEYGLDTRQTLFRQYLAYLGNVAHGNLGISISNYPTSVGDMIHQGLLWTLGLVGVATVLSFLIGTTLGALAAWHRGSWFDRILGPTLTFASSMPYFWGALLLLYLLSVVLHWFPLGGGYSVDLDPTQPDLGFYLSVAYHALLPALTIVLVSLSGWVLGMRNTMLTTLREDYVLLAQAKGLSERRVIIQYAARNALLPQVTAFALVLGSVVGGAVFMEEVFNYPGIGFELISAVQAQDYPLMQGLFLTITLAVLAANFFVDILYVFLDPRIQQGKA